MDDGDIAEARAEETLADALADWRRRQPTGPSLVECEECGEPIPEKRRLAVKGCRMCVGCQRDFERAMKRG